MSEGRAALSRQSGFAPGAPTQPRLASSPSSNGSNLFAVLRHGEVLVDRPYDAFASFVEALLDQAAEDPAVVAIKQTLCCAPHPDSRVVRALVRAADAGKDVVVVVAPRARMDEQANQDGARILADAGVQLAYGVQGLEIHANLTLILRREDGGVRRYCHIGAGNEDPATDTVDEDAALFSADPGLGADLTDLFNVLTGGGRLNRYRSLLVAPATLRPRLTALIAEQARPGGHIVMKVNGLTDPAVVDALYAASSAGAEVDLVVGDVCRLRPGVPGLSDIIRVRSIVGRYMQYVRIFRFGCAGARPRYYLGSADLHPRNMDRQVEVLASVTDPAVQDRLEEILRVNLADDVLAWELGPRGWRGWSKVPTRWGHNSQRGLQDLAKQRRQRPSWMLPGDGWRGTGTLDPGPVVQAAGGVVWRPRPHGAPEVAVIHRCKYDDWSFPKGKPTAGENPERTALREVEEETGIRCRLGRPIGQLVYQDQSGETKAVRYWEMHPLDGTFIPSVEVDEMRWLGLGDATVLLTAEHDRRLLEMMGISSMEFSVGGQEGVPAAPSSGSTRRGPSAPCAAPAPPVSAWPRRTNAKPTAIAAPRMGPTT